MYVDCSFTNKTYTSTYDTIFIFIYLLIILERDMSLNVYFENNRY